MAYLRIYVYELYTRFIQHQLGNKLIYGRAIPIAIFEKAFQFFKSLKIERRKNYKIIDYFNMVSKNNKRIFTLSIWAK